MTEEEILKALQEAEKEYANAKRVLAEAKKKWTDAETKLIHAKLHKERLQEELRINRNTVPTANPVPDLREQDIERFRNEHKELCEWAKERDRKKAEG